MVPHRWFHFCGVLGQLWRSEACQGWVQGALGGHFIKAASKVCGNLWEPGPAAESRQKADWCSSRNPARGRPRRSDRDFRCLAWQEDWAARSSGSVAGAGQGNWIWAPAFCGKGNFCHGVQATDNGLLGGSLCGYWQGSAGPNHPVKENGRWDPVGDGPASPDGHESSGPVWPRGHHHRCLAHWRRWSSGDRIQGSTRLHHPWWEDVPPVWGKVGGWENLPLPCRVWSGPMLLALHRRPPWWRLQAEDVRGPKVWWAVQWAQRPAFSSSGPCGWHRSVTTLWPSAWAGLQHSGGQGGFSGAGGRPSFGSRALGPWVPALLAGPWQAGAPWGRNWDARAPASAGCLPRHGVPMGEPADENRPEKVKQHGTSGSEACSGDLWPETLCDCGAPLQQLALVLLPHWGVAKSRVFVCRWKQLLLGGRQREVVCAPQQCTGDPKGAGRPTLPWARRTPWLWGDPQRRWIAALCHWGGSWIQTAVVRSLRPRLEEADSVLDRPGPFGRQVQTGAAGVGEIYGTPQWPVCGKHGGQWNRAAAGRHGTWQWSCSSPRDGAPDQYPRDRPSAESFSWQLGGALPGVPLVLAWGPSLRMEGGAAHQWRWGQCIQCDAEAPGQKSSKTCTPLPGGAG